MSSIQEKLAALVSIPTQGKRDETDYAFWEWIKTVQFNDITELAALTEGMLEWVERYGKENNISPSADTNGTIHRVARKTYDICPAEAELGIPLPPMVLPSIPFKEVVWNLKKLSKWANEQVAPKQPAKAEAPPQPPKAKPGRKPKYDPRKDREFMEEWERLKPTLKWTAFCRSKSKTLKEGKATLARAATHRNKNIPD